MPLTWGKSECLSSRTPIFFNTIIEDKEKKIPSYPLKTFVNKNTNAVKGRIFFIDVLRHLSGKIYTVASEANAATTT